jgi:putative membrane protein insertion efficiency factor
MVDRWLAWPLVAFMRLYRFLVSPLYGQTCRFYPSCSAYALEALERHGFVRGVRLAGWRLLRCNPWNAGGVDLVPLVRAAPPAEARRPGEPDAGVLAGRRCHHDGQPVARRAA